MSLSGGGTIHYLMFMFTGAIIAGMLLSGFILWLIIRISMFEVKKKEEVLPGTPGSTRWTFTNVEVFNNH